MARRRSIRGKRNPWIVLRQSKIHGRGVYARKRIPKGTRIIEYAGEKITSAEADRRYDDKKMAKHHTFLFILNTRWCIDASVGGNIARFINHSCDPNCVAWIIDNKIWIDALRTIEAGEELGYEYEYDFEPGYTVEDLEFYKCECGSPKCRGTIVDVPKSKRHLLVELKRRRLARQRRRKRAKK
jgi:SET domain-containing protein